MVSGMPRFDLNSCRFIVISVHFIGFRWRLWLPFLLLGVLNFIYAPNRKKLSEWYRRGGDAVY